MALDISSLYVFVSVLLLLVSYRIFNNTDDEDNSTNDKNRNYSYNKRESLGKQYLKHLLVQLDKSLSANKEKEDTFLNPLLKLKDAKDIIPFFTIVYATQSNTSKKFAEKILKEAKEVNLKCQMKNISEIDIEQDFNKNIFMVFLISTYGEGGPTDDCIDFYKFLESREFIEAFNNKELNFSIFGLGSRKYENYNYIALKFDKVLNGKLKLNRISQFGNGDDAKDINLDFNLWREQFYNDAFNYFNLNKEKTNESIIKLNLEDLYKNVQEELIVTFIENQEENSKIEINNSTNNLNTSNINLSDYDFNIKRFLNCEDCKIISIQELRKESINGSTLKITFDLTNTNINYKVGDNLGVYPLNSLSSVSKVINRLNFNEKSKVKIDKLKEQLTKKIQIIDNVTIKYLLTHIIDLSCHIK